MTRSPRPLPRWRRTALVAFVAVTAFAASGCFALSLDGKGQFESPMTGARISSLEARVHALEQAVMPQPAPVVTPPPGPAFSP
ncbi:MAG: hypothetical protein WD069_02880 [Planctomycetales bacterium]